MRFDEPSQSFVIDDDYCLPARFFINEHHEHPMVTQPGGILVHDTRVMRCTFENRWSLSIIWGSMTYSDNHDHPWGFNAAFGGAFKTYPDFVEEPTLVEVGIIMPEESVRPAVKIEGLPNWKGPVEVPEHTYELWGDPVGYVDAEGVRFLVSQVSRFNSHTWPQLESGPYIERHEDGRLSLDFTVRVTEEGYSITTAETVEDVSTQSPDVIREGGDHVQ